MITKQDRDGLEFILKDILIDLRATPKTLRLKASVCGNDVYLGRINEAITDGAGNYNHLRPPLTSWIFPRDATTCD